VLRRAYARRVSAAWHLVSSGSAGQQLQRDSQQELRDAGRGKLRSPEANGLLLTQQKIDITPLSLQQLLLYTSTNSNYGVFEVLNYSRDNFVRPLVL
jgi:hypothetical protein